MSMENNAPPSDKRPGKRTRNFAILLLILILAAWPMLTLAAALNLLR